MTLSAAVQLLVVHAQMLLFIRRVVSLYITSIAAQCNAGKYVLSPGLDVFAGWSSLGR